MLLNHFFYTYYLKKGGGGVEMQLGAASPCIVSPHCRVTGCGNALRSDWEPGQVLSHSSGLGSVTEPSLCHAHSLIEACFYTPTALNVPIKKPGSPQFGAIASAAGARSAPCVSPQAAQLSPRVWAGFVLFARPRAPLILTPSTVLLAGSETKGRAATMQKPEQGKNIWRWLG